MIGRQRRYLAAATVLAASTTAILSGAIVQASEPRSGSVSAEELRVGIFVDNAFGDRAFFDIALEAVEPLEEQGITVNTYEGRLDADAFVSILENAAEDNDLVVVLGFEAIDAMIEVAGRETDTRFVFIDAEVDSPDVVSIAYRDQEGCFLIGAVAARLTTSGDLPGTNEDNVIGFVGGVDAPVIRRCEAGYIAGAAHVDPETQVETLFVGSFVDPVLGREVNLNLMAAGSDINYQYAGLSGEGGFDAATTEEGLYALGAGFDQSFLAPGKVPASMLKNVDATILDTVDAFISGELEQGSRTTSGLDDGGLAVVFDDELVPEAVQDEINALAEEISAGTIEMPAG